MKLEQTWLGRMWQTDRKLFVVIAVYGLGLLGCAALSREEFPFLLYGMYSLKEEPQEEYTGYEVIAAGQYVQFTDVWDAGSELITATMLHGLDLEEKGQLTPEQTKALHEWLYRYIIDMRFVEDNTLKVNVLNCRYDSTGTPQITARKTVIDYAAN